MYVTKLSTTSSCLNGSLAPPFTVNNLSKVYQVIALVPGLVTLKRFLIWLGLTVVTSTHSHYCHLNGYFWTILLIQVEESSRNKKTNIMIHLYIWTQSNVTLKHLGLCGCHKTILQVIYNHVALFINILLQCRVVT